MGVERVKVQLWDCSGSMQYQPYWTVLAKVRFTCSSHLLYAGVYRSAAAHIFQLVLLSHQQCGLMNLLLQDLDGIILVIDPQHPEQEKELETLYMNFAQVCWVYKRVQYNCTAADTGDLPLLWMSKI